MSVEEAPALADRVRSIMMETFEKISKEVEAKQKITNAKFNHTAEATIPKRN